MRSARTPFRFSEAGQQTRSALAGPFNIKAGWCRRIGLSVSPSGAGRVRWGRFSLRGLGRCTRYLISCEMPGTPTCEAATCGAIWPNPIRLPGAVWPSLRLSLQTLIARFSPARAVTAWSATGLCFPSHGDPAPDSPGIMCGPSSWIRHRNSFARPEQALHRSAANSAARSSRRLKSRLEPALFTSDRPAGAVSGPTTDTRPAGAVRRSRLAGSPDGPGPANSARPTRAGANCAHRTPDAVVSGRQSPSRAPPHARKMAG